ncbi:hypothetical protein ACFL67_02250 [candidate division KSB1 bacterium]
MVEEKLEKDSIVENNNEANGNSFREAQLVLAEKRTSLAVVRTAIMIFALPLTVLTALIGFSGYYDFKANIWLMVPIIIISTLLFIVAFFLIFRAIKNITLYDRMLENIRKCDPGIGHLIPKADTRIIQKKY